MTQLSEVFIRIQTPFLSTLYSNALQPTATTVSTVLSLLTLYSVTFIL